MRDVRDILKKKGGNVVAMGPDDTVYEMLELGIVSERDYARSVALLGRSSKETLVRDIMTARVLVVSPTHRVQDCMELMTDKHIRHLPVVEGERVIGLVSIGDVVKEIITEQQSLIADLENYIGPAR